MRIKKRTSQADANPNATVAYFQQPWDHFDNQNYERFFQVVSVRPESTLRRTHYRGSSSILSTCPSIIWIHRISFCSAERVRDGSYLFSFAHNWMISVLIEPPIRQNTNEMAPIVDRPFPGAVSTAWFQEDCAWVTYAKEIGAALYSLEHRYYGDSKL